MKRLLWSMLVLCLFSGGPTFADDGESSPDTVEASKQKAARLEEYHAGDDEHAPPTLRLNLNNKGTQYIRFITWVQLWLRAQQMNPGTTVKGEAKNSSGDVALRRARFLVIGQILPEVLMVFHIGINNQTFVRPEPPSVFVHEAYSMVRLLGDYLHFGAGLHYWNGISRLSSASMINSMVLDAPFLNWPTISRTDVAARQLGLFVKGDIAAAAYRLALNRPFVADTTLSPGGPVDYHPATSTWAITGYAKWMFVEHEHNSTAAQVGTYLGTKRVFNVGAGFYWQEAAMARQTEAGATEEFDALNIGVDLFLDWPFGNSSALTSYLVYYYYDMGPDFVRNMGIGNIGEEGTSFNGAGNAYPVMGTGHHLYGQVGYLLPWRARFVRFQPYASLQLSIMDGLGDVSVVPEAGLNVLGMSHHIKITLHYRSRPVFEGTTGEPKVASRKNEFITQLQTFF